MNKSELEESIKDVLWYINYYESEIKTLRKKTEQQTILFNRLNVLLEEEEAKEEVNRNHFKD